ncbi:MAG: GAP family protein, partial [Acidimicrobiia bacterium]
MREVIGQVLPFAVGAALSPFPIIAMVLMLVTSRARANSLSFLVGWVVGLAAIGVVVLTVASGVDASSSDASDGVNWTKFGLGVILVVVAARHLRKRPTG